MKHSFLKLILLLTVSLNVKAQELGFNSFSGTMDDLNQLGLTKEKIYQSMNQDTIKLGQSICSNRAMMWLADFELDFNLKAGKIFLFYTNKTGHVGQKTWWYHVSPMVVENGQEWIMDAGFPGYINSPLSTNDWIKKFIGSSNCKVIESHDRDLIDYMYRGQTFPEKYQGKNYDCYTIKTPAGYWTPASVAMHLLKYDYNGNPITFNREELNMSEVYTACKEAVTGPLALMLGLGRKKCKKYKSSL
jgi:hypothetical protein